MQNINVNVISSNINSEDATANRTEIYRLVVRCSWKKLDELSQMTQGEKAAFYKRAFDDLLQLYTGQDTITLYGQYGKPRTTTFAELEACKQIYTEDRTEKFWKVRN